MMLTEITNDHVLNSGEDSDGGGDDGILVSLTSQPTNHQHFP